MTIRLLEEEKLMKTYHSYLEHADFASRPEIISIIEEADRCSELLRAEVPSLVESYREWCKDPSSFGSME